MFICLIVLILISGFFSGSETSMMSLNRYKLRHLARKGHKSAKRSQQLLEKPDRLLGVILLGNTFANILASSLATIIAGQLWGEVGVAVATIVLTIVILIFSEIMPKTFAALHPAKFAFPVSQPLAILLKIIYPIVWGLNSIANFLLKLCGVSAKSSASDSLTKEELKTVVNESAQQITKTHQHMLLGVLDLEHATVEDVMIPRNKIMGIDINDGWHKVLEQIINSPYSKMPVYRDNIDQVIGILHLRKALKLINQPQASIHTLEQLVEKPHFTPETTSLQQQIIVFQKNAQHFSLVVDEYGEIQGMIALEDIVEEIVGQFTSDQPSNTESVFKQADGSYFVAGSLTIRDLNRALSINLPITGAKTLSGLITEYLQRLPTAKTCIKINNYPIEIMVLEGNTVKKARIRTTEIP